MEYDFSIKVQFHTTANILWATSYYNRRANGISVYSAAKQSHIVLIKKKNAENGRFVANGTDKHIAFLGLNPCIIFLWIPCV